MAKRKATFSHPIPVIDLFAGPGGLSKGCASMRCSRLWPAFQIALPAQKDESAQKAMRRFAVGLRDGGSVNQPVSL